MALELASLDDLRAAVPGVSDEVAQSALTRAAALVRRVARQSFDYTENDTIVLTGGGRDLQLPEGPVVVDDDHPLAVTGLDGSGVDVGPMVAGQHFTRAGGVLSRPQVPAYVQSWSPAYGLGFGGFGWPPGAWPPLVRVTYTHGYETAPDWLSAIVVNAAAIYATNPEGLYSLRVGGIDKQFMRSTVQGATTVTDQIKAELTAVGLLRGGAFTIVPAAGP